jgi:UDP-3-O-[3-hydroxymyristoyl] glucosamine N-acyltransferase
MYGNAVIKDFARVLRASKVCGNVSIEVDARIGSDTEIYDNAVVKDVAKVNGYAKVCGNAKIENDAKVGRGAIIYGNAVIKMSKEAIESSVLGNAVIST